MFILELFFFNCLHTFPKLCLFLFKIQELHTQNTKCLTSFAKWSTAFKISQTDLKIKHVSYVANTFAIIYVLDISYVIQNLMLFFFTISICDCGYSIKQNEIK